MKNNSTGSERKVIRGKSVEEAERDRVREALKNEIEGTATKLRNEQGRLEFELKIAQAKVCILDDMNRIEIVQPRRPEDKCLESYVEDAKGAPSRLSARLEEIKDHLGFLEHYKKEADARS